MDRKEGFVYKMNFKRTWGVIQDQQGENYYFEEKDLNFQSFALMEGMPVSFVVVEDATKNPADLPRKGVEIEVTDEKYARYRIRKE